MILFVDDEKREMDSYVQELELSRYEVSFQTDVDVALNVFDEEFNRIDLLILDIMMPPGSSFDNSETEMGVRTGVRFYERIRERTTDLPVVILTNVSDEGVRERFCGESKCWFLRKEDYLPFQLAEEVEKIVGAAN